jgi:hypothetical protein
MTLHHSIRNLLDQRAADVAKDIDHTEAALTHVMGEYDRTVAALNSLREEEAAIGDARRLLGELQEGT